RAYDVKGHDRVVRRVEVLYQTEGRFGGNATFQVYGLRDTAGPGLIGGGWITLGTVRANLSLDHDTISVGAGMGTFRSLRFHVTRRPIHLYDIRVTFGNGSTQVYNFNRHINAGAWSVPLDLAGDRRIISRVDIVYKKDPSSPGDAHLTIQGRSSASADCPPNAKAVRSERGARPPTLRTVREHPAGYGVWRVSGRRRSSGRLLKN